MSEPRSNTDPTSVRSPRAPFWSVICRVLLWGPICGGVLAVAVSFTGPLAAVLFPSYFVAGAVVGFVGSVAGILVALGVWFLVRAGGVGVRGRAVAAATTAAITVPALWAWALLALVSPTEADRALESVCMLIVPVAIASIVLAAFLCRRFLRTESTTG